MKDNLERLRDARAGMSLNEARAFSHYFIGALQSHVDPDEWDSCLLIAKQCVEAVRAKNLEAV